MKSVLKIVAAVILLVGLLLFAYALYQTFAISYYASKTVSVDSMDLISLFLIVSGYWIIVKKTPEKEQGPSH
jgi:uncharacterized membrane protein